jgi:hypothetical protein
MDREIFGPWPGREPSLKRQVLAGSFIDVDESSPFEDLVALFFYPRKFFDYFAQSSKNIGAFELCKGIVGLLVIQLLVAIVSDAQHGLLEATASLLEELKAQPQWPLLVSRWDLEGFDRIILGGAAFFDNVLFVLQPIQSLTTLLLSAGAATLVLSLLGSKIGESFVRNLAVLSYLGWYSLLALLPHVGSMLMLLVPFLLSLWCFKRVYKLGNFQALLASQFVSWIWLIVGGLGFAVTAWIWAQIL